MNTTEHILSIINSHPSASLVPPERRVQMANSLALFVCESIIKYYSGQEAHGGDICDRDLDREIRQEQIDQFWYSEAMKWKQQVDKSS